MRNRREEIEARPFGWIFNLLPFFYTIFLTRITHEFFMNYFFFFSLQINQIYLIFCSAKPKPERLIRLQAGVKPPLRLAPTI